MTMFKRIASLCLISVVVACGGGGDGGTSLFTTGSGTTGGTSTNGSGTTGVASGTTGSVVMNVSSSVISSSTPGVVTALAKDASGAPIVGTIVTFTITDAAVASVRPATVLTDSTGSASATIVPASSAALGATYVTAMADAGGSSISARLAFSVSAVSITLDSLTTPATTLAAYSSTPLSVAVTGASSSTPITVAFSSSCVTAGKATISPSSLTLSSGTGSVTYQDRGCNSTDHITANVAGTSQTRTVDLIDQAPTSQAIEFVSAQPPTICLAGSGCPSASIVSFKVTDQFGQPVAGRSVDFALDIPGVAGLSFTNAVSDSSGLVSVSVLSKTVPTPVRVSAKVTGTTLATVSNALSINAGLPTQQAMSFSASIYNVDGLETDGRTSDIRIQLNDRFGNPVPDGTSVSFVAEGAAVIPAQCQTIGAVCAVQFVSSNFRPANGRITVVAYAQGEESFSDLNGNNTYDSGESFADLGEVYVDKNESGTMDAGEFIAGSAANGTWDSNIYVRTSRLFILSSSGKAPRLFEPDANGGCTSSTPLAQFTLPLAASCRVSKRVCIRDGNTAADALGGNPLPAAATLTTSTVAVGATVTVDNSPIASNLNGPTAHFITAQRADCATAATAAGPIDLTIAMPNSGPRYTFTVGTVTP
jgi:hypothetical protein